MIAATGSEQAFAFLRKLIYDNSAIVLEADKRYLLGGAARTDADSRTSRIFR